MSHTSDHRGEPIPQKCDSNNSCQTQIRSWLHASTTPGIGSPLRRWEMRCELRPILVKLNVRRETYARMRDALWPLNQSSLAGSAVGFVMWSGRRKRFLLLNCYKWCKDALYTHVSGLFVNATLSPSSSISGSTSAVPSGILAALVDWRRQSYALQKCAPHVTVAFWTRRSSRPAVHNSRLEQIFADHKIMAICGV